MIFTILTFKKNVLKRLVLRYILRIIQIPAIQNKLSWKSTILAVAQRRRRGQHHRLVHRRLHALVGSRGRLGFPQRSATTAADDDRWVRRGGGCEDFRQRERSKGCVEVGNGAYIRVLRRSAQIVIEWADYVYSFNIQNPFVPSRWQQLSRSPSIFLSSNHAVDSGFHFKGQSNLNLKLKRWLVDGG